jgi:hypothetical protein
MASFDFRISYATSALPAWEASRALRGITHLYYYGLLARNENYTRRLNVAYYVNGRLIPEDLTSKLHITESDQLFLEVRSLSPSLEGTGSTDNDEAAIHASDAMDVIKRLREEFSAKDILDHEKQQKVSEDQEVRRRLLNPLERSQLDAQLKRTLIAATILACVSLLADSIESFEFTLKHEAA